MAPRKSQIIAQRVARIDAATRTAYSRERYLNWQHVIATLLTLGYGDKETAAILLSKYMRWAADQNNAPYGRVRAAALLAFRDHPRNADLWTSVAIAKLVASTDGLETL